MVVVNPLFGRVSGLSISVLLLSLRSCYYESALECARVEMCLWWLFFCYAEVLGKVVGR